MYTDFQCTVSFCESEDRSNGGATDVTLACFRHTKPVFGFPVLYAKKKNG